MYIVRHLCIYLKNAIKTHINSNEGNIFAVLNSFIFNMFKLIAIINKPPVAVISTTIASVRNCSTQRAHNTIAP
jgi:hypothetical protein